VIRWPSSDLARISETDDLRISPYREDGRTPGTPTWIWSVVVDGELYVRAYNGRNSRWYQAAMQQRAGQIREAGVTHDVTFEPVDDTALQQHIDGAYGAKYKGSPYLNPMVGARARSATVRIVPRAS
jgi:hypothetical protein